MKALLALLRHLLCRSLTRTATSFVESAVVDDPSPGGSGRSVLVARFGGGTRYNSVSTCSDVFGEAQSLRTARLFPGDLSDRVRQSVTSQVETL